MVISYKYGNHSNIPYIRSHSHGKFTIIDIINIYMLFYNFRFDLNFSQSVSTVILLCVLFFIS